MKINEGLSDEEWQQVRDEAYSRSKGVGVALIWIGAFVPFVTLLVIVFVLCVFK